MMTFLKVATAGLLLAGASALGAQAAPATATSDTFQLAQLNSKMRGAGDDEFIRKRRGGGGDMRGPRFSEDMNCGGRRFDDRRRYSWDRNRHGPRYSYRRNGYNHYRDGYYYASPWWTGAAAGAIIGSAIAGSAASRDSHVDYCLNRYRSYNPQTDTYTGAGGRQYRCISP